MFKGKVSELRNAVTLLTGYRVDLIEDKQYRVYSTYAHRNNVLRFRTNDQGDMDLLESDFASQLTTQIDMYLRDRHSIPAFLSAVTLSLFDGS